MTANQHLDAIQQMADRESERIRRITPPRIATFLQPSNTVSALDTWTDKIRTMINDPGCQDHIILKAARAVTEHRIPEGEIAKLLAATKNARTRGPYFVSGLKRIFGVYDLSWREEEWS